MTNLTVIANVSSPTNLGLGPVMTPAQAVARLRPGDIALGRIDVQRSLQGIEEGLWALDVLERRGVTVLNPSSVLTRAHDKLLTARSLELSGLPHPITEPVGRHLGVPDVGLPVVLKPRFGSWGRDVVRCESREEFACAYAAARGRLWFNTAGGVVQELVPPRGYDLRLVVAAGRIVGAAKRISAPGEWRTNVALGAHRIPVEPPHQACELAVAAAAAIGGDLVGVDLLPTDDGWTVIEINGAVDFTDAYAIDGEEIFALVRRGLLDNVLRRDITATLVSARNEAIAVGV